MMTYGAANVVTQVIANLTNASLSLRVWRKEDVPQNYHYTNNQVGVIYARF